MNIFFFMTWQFTICSQRQRKKRKNILKNNKINSYFNNELNKRSQKFNDQYYDSASFYIFPRNIINYKSVKEYANNFIGFEISQFDSVDIDNKDNWLLAEALYTFKRNNEK